MDSKKLQEENAALRKELLDARTLYNQLVQETSQEQLDERRIYLLKSQVIQLERQLLLMSDALTSRSATLLEVENSLSWLADYCRSLIGVEVKGPEVPVPRSRLTEMVEKLESSRIKLYKNIENTSQETLSKPLMFFNDFVKPDKQGEVTLFDICSGHLDHINLKQVAKLESHLCLLYKDLISVHQSLTSTHNRVTTALKCPVTDDRLTTQILKAMARLDGCTQDLLSLSLLYPAAPWPPLKRPISGEINNDRVISSLPTLPRSKAGEVQKVIEALMKVTNHRLHTREQERKALQDEVKFHTAVYRIQNQYIEGLFEAVKTGYREFEENVEKSLCKPLTEVLHAYDELKNTSSEEALRVFLKSFKDRSENLESAVMSLSQMQTNEGESPGLEGLSSFGRDFFKELDKQCEKVRLTRDQNLYESKALKEEQEKLDAALVSLLDEIKTAKQPAEETSSARKMLQKNKEDGPAIEFKLKTNSGNSAYKNSGQSTDMSDSDSSSVSSHSNSKLCLPSSRGPKSSPKSPVRYSKNRTLNLRRSGSLSRLTQTKDPISFCPAARTNESPTNVPVSGVSIGSVRRTSAGSVSLNTVSKETSGSDSNKTSGNVSALPRRKIPVPTLKAPFR